MNRINYVWLTLNRECNLRCNWCYAKGTEFSLNKTMNFELAKELVDFSKQLQIEELSLIGGEPTCYPKLKELICYIRNNGLISWLITNGLKFENEHYLEELIESGLNGVNFSLKGWSKQSYIDNTGMDVYERILHSLKNVCESSINCKVSFVISADNIDHLFDIVKIATSCGAKDFFFSFEHDFSVLDGKSNTFNISNVAKVVADFSKYYNKLNILTKGNFVLHQSYPLCVWDDEIIQQLTENNQIITSCSLINRSGLFFDTDGSLIPCNAMYQVPIGKFRTDFKDSKSFDFFWNSIKINSIYNVLRRLPNTKCSDCDNALNCGGGCISNWYNYSYDDLINSHIIKH